MRIQPTKWCARSAAAGTAVLALSACTRSTLPNPSHPASDERPAEHLNRALHPDPSAPGWQAGDGTISVPLDAGRTLWLFGDSLVQSDARGTPPSMVRNAGVVTSATGAALLAPPHGRAAVDLLHTPASGTWLWPHDGIREGDHITVLAQRMRRTDTASAWGFAPLDTQLVTLDAASLTQTGTRTLALPTDTELGQCIVSDGDYTYVYGLHDASGHRQAIVARTRTGHVGDGDFTYWDGTSWQRDATRAAPLADGLSNQFSVVRTPGGRWAMISQELGFGTGLQACIANSPAGPWGPWSRIDDGPSLPAGTISYNAEVHPSVSANGTLVVSWNSNRADGALPGGDQLDTYRPVFRELDAHMLDRISPAPVDDRAR